MIFVRSINLYVFTNNLHFNVGTSGERRPTICGGGGGGFIKPKYVLYFIFHHGSRIAGQKKDIKWDTNEI